MYNDEQLKQALAKMLPEKIAYEDAWLFWKRWPEKILGQHASRKVLDTELLHLCWEIEVFFTPIESHQYAELLLSLCEWTLNRDYKLSEWKNSHYIVAHATWQQRVIALAQVKGIEIV